MILSNLIFLFIGFIFGFIVGVLYYFVKNKKLIIFIYDEIDELLKLIEKWKGL
jgi:hypothetical protein